MQNIWLVLKHEIITTLRRKSFWVMTFLMPAFLILFNGYYILQDNGAVGSASESNASAHALPQLPRIGLVDESGLVAAVPPDLPANVFTRYADADAARADLDAGNLNQIVVIPADYLASGDVLIYAPNFQLFSAGSNASVAFGGNHEWMLRYLLNYNISGDPALAVALADPTPAALANQIVTQPATEASSSAQAQAELVATIIPYIYYFILLIVSGYMMQSVTAEKENRVVELLLLSLQPRQLMVGKILGLTVVALLQLVIWFGGGVFMLRRSAVWLNAGSFTFPPSFFIWATLFLLFGYLAYAAIMAAAGAIAPTAREGNQVTWLLVVPLLPTLMFSRVFLESPHGALSLGLSLFPLSAPSAMVTRIAVAQVPLWQILLSLSGLALTAYLFVTLAGRFFQPDNLLSAASFNWKRLATGWRRS